MRFYPSFIFSVLLLIVACHPDSGRSSTRAWKLYANYQLQEAIWVARKDGQKELGEEFKKKLESHLMNDAYFEYKPELHNDNKGYGVPTKKFFQFSNGIRAIFKPSSIQAGTGHSFSYWQSEVAAYRLDQLLGFDIVPMTVEFTDKNGTKGSLQVMVDFNGLGMTSGGGLDSQSYNSMQLFDYLTANFDRDNFWHFLNWFYWPAEDRVIAFDNGTAFQERTAGCFVLNTNDLYIGWKDYPRRGRLGPEQEKYYIVDPCPLDMVRDENGKLRPGVDNQFNFSRLNPSIKHRIETITDRELIEVLAPYVNKHTTFNDEPSKMDLDAILRRFHRVKSALYVTCLS